MLPFLAFLAATNLIAGYVLGAYLHGYDREAAPHDEPRAAAAPRPTASVAVEPATTTAPTPARPDRARRAPAAMQMEGLALLDAVLAEIEALDDDISPEKPLLVAAVEIDPWSADASPSDEVAIRIERQIAALAAEIAGADHISPAEETNRFLVSLTGRSYYDAVQQLEQLRQKVAATTFVAAGAEHVATVTCALAESQERCAREVWRKQIDEGLAEARVTGGNRTFHHDGAFATAAPAAELSIAPTRVEV